VTCKDCVYAAQPTTTMRCKNHGIFIGSNAVVCNEFKGKPQTNADRIRAMTNEELAEYLSGDEAYERTHWSMRHWLDWLKQEAT